MNTWRKEVLEGKRDREKEGFTPHKKESDMSHRNAVPLILISFFSLLMVACANTPVHKTTPVPLPMEGENGQTADTSSSGDTSSFPWRRDKCIHEGSGRDYPVGPGQHFTALSEVPWTTLGPGDTVRIHWRREPYRTKILISGRGSPDQPIRICGVANEEGKLPVISGRDASTPQEINQLDNYFSSDHDNFQGLGLVILSGNYDEKPANIVIEGLHLQHARDEYRFTNSREEKRAYGKGAACIRIQAADNVVIRNNEIDHCGNGIFTMSQTYNEAALTRNLLIEGNHLHDNGQPGSYLEHNLYIQAIGVTYQFNRFGPNTPGAEGVNLKDRSAGTVIRYNWFEGGTRVMDLVEVEDSAPWFIEQAYLESLGGSTPDLQRLAEVRATEARYRNTYVYGNLIRHIGSIAPASNLIHYGYDNDPELARKGTLFFYHNTLMLLNDRDDSWRIRLFDVYPYDEEAGTPAAEQVEAFNNIIYLAAETSGAAPSYFCFGRSSGHIHLGSNWVSAGWNSAEALAECYGDDIEPIITGIENVADTSGSPLPLDLETLLPLNVPALHQLQPVPASIHRVHPVKYQYVHHQRGELRPLLDTLGALEPR